MSLIQQALERTNRAQEAKIEAPPPPPKAYERDPMGASLEQELTRVQESYARRRRFYRNVLLGVLFFGFISGSVYFLMRQVRSEIKPQAKVVAAPAVPPVSVQIPAQLPVRIDLGSIYRLTGITTINGKAMALINERIVSVGDPLPGKAVVKAIGNGEVRLDVQGREIKLTL